MIPSTKKLFYSFALITITSLCVPLFTHAYTFNGRYFDTFEEMQRYIVAYMEVWNELHGNDSSSNTNTTRTGSKRTSSIEIETGRATDIANSSARLVGTFDLKRSERVRIWFDYGYTSKNLGFRTETEILDKNHGSKNFDRKLQGLLPNTTYYYRAGGINEDGAIAYGEIKSFKTTIDERLSNALIQIQTSSATNIDDNRATLRGNVNFKKETIAYVWFEYGEDKDDLYKKTRVLTATKTNGRTISYTISNLEDEEEYYYRFIGKDKNGEMRYGKVKKFTTRKNVVDEKPKVTTLRAENVGVYTATLGGEVDMNDYRNGITFLVYGEDKEEVDEVSEEYRRYSRIKERGDDLQKILLDDDLDRYASFKKTIAYLDMNTRYYYAIGVEYENDDNDDVLLMGRTYSFTTKDLY